MLLLLFACVEKAEDSGPVEGDTAADTGAAGAPAMSVSTAEVAFGETCAPASQLVDVANGGAAPLELHGLSLEGDQGQAFALSSLGSVLVPPGGATSFSVTFSPPAPGDYTAEAVLEGGDVPEVRVPLSGSCSAGVAEASPATLDLGTVGVGCVARASIQVANLGNADLVIEGFDVETAGEGVTVDADEEVNGALPWVLAPGEYVGAYVEWSPLTDAPLSGAVTVRTSAGEETVALAGTAAYGGWVTETVEVPEITTLDMVWVVDATVGDELAYVSAAFPALLAALEASGYDWQVTAVMPDDGCQAVGPAWIDATTADPQGTWDTMTAYGGSMRYAEMGFTVLANALSATSLGPGGCNEGLYRFGELALVGVTDENEQSADPWSHYVATFQALTTTPDLLTVNAFAGDYPSGCGGNGPGEGWYEATAATGGTFASICDTDWTDEIATMVGTLPGATGTEELDHWPIPETITVTVDGVERTEWTYNAVDNTVEFEPPLDPGQVAEITYATYGAC